MANIEDNIILDIIQKQITLEQISNMYFDHCKDNMGIFNGCSLLVELIQTNKIQDASRYTAIFLLLICYKDEAPENNPFIWTILEISKNTFQPLQRQLIRQILINGNLNKYYNYDMTNFRESVQEVHQIADEDKNIEDIREKVFGKFKEIQSYTKIAQVLTDEEQISQIQFLRPIPDFIEVSNSELHWLSPGIISDIQWDNSAEIEKRLDKVRKIFFNALDRVLEAQQRSQILGLIQSDPYCPIQIGFKKQYLRSLVANNPYLASALVIKIAKTPMLCQYLQQFLRIPTTVQIFDSLCRITKDVCIPKGYLIFFCEHHMKKIIKSNQQMDDKKSVAATMAAFLQCMFENQIFTLYEIKKTLLDFMTYFEKVIDFAHIKILLDRENNQNR